MCPVKYFLQLVVNSNFFIDEYEIHRSFGVEGEVVCEQEGSNCLLVFCRVPKVFDLQDLQL